MLVSQVVVTKIIKQKSTNIRTKIIKEGKEVICPYLTDCINAIMKKCCFLKKLKEADVSSIHKKDDKCRKVNYRPISVLSGMSKIFKRIMSEQITQYFIGILSSLLSGFRHRDTAHNMPCFELLRLGKRVSIFRVQ